MQVRDVMRRTIHRAHPRQSADDAAQVMSWHGIGFLPVMDEGGLIGVITDRDIVVRCDREKRDPRHARVRDAMTGRVACCHEDDDLNTAAAIMAKAHVRKLPVLWHMGQPNLIGIVSFYDSGNKVGRDLIYEILETQHVPDPRTMARPEDPVAGTAID